MEDINPKTFSSHTTTQITTTALRIDLIEPAIGMNEFTSHSSTPTTISTNNTCTSGIFISSALRNNLNFESGIGRRISQSYASLDAPSFCEVPSQSSKEQ